VCNGNDLDTQAEHTVDDEERNRRAFSVPLRPMIGTIGVAPGGGEAVGANALGSHGGNLDYNRT
jgi:amidase